MIRLNFPGNPNRFPLLSFFDMPRHIKDLMPWSSYRHHLKKKISICVPVILKLHFLFQTPYLKLFQARLIHVRYTNISHLNPEKPLALISLHTYPKCFLLNAEKASLASSNFLPFSNSVSDSSIAASVSRIPIICS